MKATKSRIETFKGSLKGFSMQKCKEISGHTLLKRFTSILNTNVYFKYLGFTELIVPGTCHFIFLKSDIPSHVSSILRKTFFFRAWPRNSIAHLYLRTKFFSEFECRDTVLILRNFISISSFITFLTSLSLTDIPF